MTFYVGSTNPVKINCVKIALEKDFPFSEVRGVDVVSGVSSQPMSDAETRKGSMNRAKAVLQFAKEKKDPEPIGIGLEGGIFFGKKKTEMWTTVWCVLIDQSGRLWESNGARIRVPPIVAEKILQGQEMGHVMQDLTGIEKVKQKNGMFGVITNEFVTRTEEYAGIAKIAIGLWYGREWEKKISRST